MRAPRPVIGLLFVPAMGAVYAEPIQYGDFDGSDVMYLDVTETANTPGDPGAILGPPSIQGNTLAFEPPNLNAEATGKAAAARDGQLNFTLMASGRPTIRHLALSASGVYTVEGTGGGGTRVGYALSLSSVKVLELDDAALASPVDLEPASGSGSEELDGGGTTGAAWDLDLAYDVNAALTEAGVSFSNGATKLEVAMDVMLVALSEGGGQAVIDGGTLAVVANEPVPVLTIVRSGPDQVVLSWTPSTPGYTLQQAPDLGGGGWTEAPTGATNPVTLSIVGPRRFFRLFRP